MAVKAAKPPSAPLPSNGSASPLTTRNMSRISNVTAETEFHGDVASILSEEINYYLIFYRQKG